MEILTQHNYFMFDRFFHCLIFYTESSLEELPLGKMWNTFTSHLLFYYFHQYTP
jgi:hypothetical protein